MKKKFIMYVLSTREFWLDRDKGTTPDINKAHRFTKEKSKSLIEDSQGHLIRLKVYR